MFIFTVLGSGSAGNCALLRTERTRLLVDAGFSARQIVERLARVATEPRELSGVLVTHEHGDHVKGLAVLGRRHGVPVYVTARTAEALRRGGEDFEGVQFRLFEAGAAFRVGDLEVQSFPVPHDAVDPVGYAVGGPSGDSVGILTDLGYATATIRERLRNVHTLLLETNHDLPTLLGDPKRPWSLKQRITSRHGHLSNEDAAQLAADLALRGQLRRLVLGHLSRDCNSPALAEKAVRAALAAIGLRGFAIHTACQDAVSQPYFLSEQLLSV